MLTVAEAVESSGRGPRSHAPRDQNTSRRQRRLREHLDDALDIDQDFL